jgi:hypothetical protein
MGSVNADFSIIYDKFIAKSLFTARQIDIILKRLNAIKPDNISSGAYYRQLKQCRNKILRVYYSIVLLSIIGLIQDHELSSLATIANKVQAIAGTDINDNVEAQKLNEVMLVIDTIITNISKI